MRRRRGISLIELLAVLSGCSVVLGLTASLLHQTMRAQSHTREFFDVERSSQRLARQFRSDVHAAATDSIDVVDSEDAPDRELLRLQLPDGQTIAYQRSAAKVIRIVTQTDAPTAREEYALSESMEIDVRRVDSPQRLVLSIVSAPPLPSQDAPLSSANLRAATVHLEVEAAPARNLRYAEPAASAEEGT
jgi:type II secretory pathway component PulJ